MKKFFALIVLVFALAGCSEAEREFAAAMRQLTDAGYYEAESKLTYELSAEGGGEDFQNEMQMLGYIVNAMSFEVKSAVRQDGGSVKTYADVYAALAPFTFNGELWAELGDNKYDIIIKIPALFKTLLNSTADYAYIDYIAVNEIQGNAQVPGVSNPQRDIIETARRYGTEDSLAGNVTITSRAEGGGKILSLHMSDAQLKNFLAEFFNGLIHNETFQQEMMDMYLAQFASIGMEYTAEELEAFGITAEALAPVFEMMFKPFADVLSATTVLGEEGFTYEIALDNNGTVISDRMDLDIRVDAAALDGLTRSMLPMDIIEFAPYAEPEPEEESGIIHMRTVITNSYSNINGGGELELPALTEENTYDVAEQMRIEEEQRRLDELFYFPSMYIDESFLADSFGQPDNFPLKGTFGGEEYDGEITLGVFQYETEYYSSETLAMPAAQAAELFGGRYYYDEEENIGYWTVDDYDAVILPMTYEEMTDEVWEQYGSYSIALGFINDGELYMELTYVESYAGLDLGYDDETGTVLIRDRTYEDFNYQGF